MSLLNLFEFKERGYIKVKGKEEAIKTYFLIKKKNT